MDRLKYQQDLEKRQEEHLERVRQYTYTKPFVACLHDSCSYCIGTGIKLDGSFCFHHLHCSCPKCSVTATVQHDDVSNGEYNVDLNNFEGYKTTVIL